MDASRQHLIRLFLISFSALALEVLLIRWIATEVRLFGYFKNLILMACFLGLGAGCATPAPSSGEASRPKVLFAGLLAILVIIISTATSTDLINISLLIDRNVFDYNIGIDSPARLLINILCVYGILLLVVMIFDSLGRQLGREFAGLPPLKAYMVNLFGSLGGVLCFCVISLLHLGPAYWIAAASLPLVPLFLPDKKRLSIFLACTVVSISVAFASTNQSIWSPYYRIDLEPVKSYTRDLNSVLVPYVLGTCISVSHSTHQRIMNFSTPFLKEHPDLGMSNEFRAYELPYSAVPHPKDVLVLGAGTGNDVSAALRHGAEHVDAIEIDPEILKLGKRLHPEKPYDNPVVTPHNEDANTFLARTDKKYDLIQFGALDSLTALSTVSSLRLDNYLYTKESLTQATAHLSANGIASMSFSTQPDWLRARLYQMVQLAYPQSEPLAFDSQYYAPKAILLMWGPGVDAVRKDLQAKYAKILSDPQPLKTMAVEVPTLDWPFLYQYSRTIPISSLVILVSMLGISAILVYFRFKLRGGQFVSNSQFFLLGAGFLLMETRAMLAVAVLFGSTWMVNSVIISLVLLMAIAATLVTMRTKFFTQKQAYIALLVSLAILYAFPVLNLVAAAPAIKYVGGALLLGPPFFFSGIVFARAIDKSSEAQVALGLNILGAIVGGCLEYLCAVIGTNGLVLLAMGIYGLSWLTARKN